MTTPTSFSNTGSDLGQPLATRRFPGFRGSNGLYPYNAWNAVFASARSGWGDNAIGIAAIAQGATNVNILHFCSDMPAVLDVETRVTGPCFITTQQVSAGGMVCPNFHRMTNGLVGTLASIATTTAASQGAPGLYTIDGVEDVKAFPSLLDTFSPGWLATSGGSAVSFAVGVRLVSQAGAVNTPYPNFLYNSTTLVAGCVYIPAADYALVPANHIITNGTASAYVVGVYEDAT